MALATDDRSAEGTLRLGATDHNLRLAIAAGLPAETAFRLVTLNPARLMRLTPRVGQIAPGRYADIVLLDDVAGVGIAEIWADGQPVAAGGRLTAALPMIDWPLWARRTVQIDRPLSAADFAVSAPPGRATVQAAVLRPFHWADELLLAR